MYGERLPPHDIEAEEAVVGSILIDPEAIYRVASFLKPQDFYREQNRWAYEASLALFERSEAINQITLAYELSQRGRIEDMGGGAYLTHVVSMVPTSVHIEHYASIVQRTALMRRLITGAGQIAALGYDGGPDADAVLSKAEDILYSLRLGRVQRDFVPLRQLLDDYFEESGLLPPAERAAGARIGTGFVDLDRLMGGGLQRSDLLILAARPSLGKTTLALNIARNAALKERAKVAIFSVEMAKEQLVHRLLASEAGVDARHVRLGQYSEAEEHRLMDAIGRLSEAPVWVDDSSTLRVVEMRSKVRRLHNEQGLDLVIVDYLQLMEGSSRTDNRVQVVDEISRSLKAVARELEVPVLAVSQLSRAVEMRPSHVPQLSDLRESGSIEQDADVVMFIYREDVYSTEEDWIRHNPTKDIKDYPKGVAEIIVAKHRHGPVGRVTLRFVEKEARFADFPTKREGPLL